MNLPDRVLGPRRIAVVPVHDEEATVVQTLEKLTRVVDEVLVVDDGSTDATRREVRGWLSQQGEDDEEDEAAAGVGLGGLPGRLLRRGRLLCFDQHHGPSAAYRLAFADLRRRLDDGMLSPDDVVLTLDPAGRHELDFFDDLQRLAVKERLDALLLRREQSGRPLARRVGNGVISGWASLWAGKRLHDVESGYRIFRLAPLADALDLYRSRRSGHIELAVAMARLGCRVRNDVLVSVPAGTPGTPGPSVLDAVADAVAVPRVAFRAVRAAADAEITGGARGAGAALGSSPGPGREADPAATLTRLATPLAATAALVGATLWLLGWAARRLRRLLPHARSRRY